MTTHIGLIGGGNITETHARAARAIAGVRLPRSLARMPKRSSGFARNTAEKPFGDFEAFLAHRPMDIVIIGSPSGLHAVQGVAAAEHGLHVLTEKPIDTSTERADALIEAADKAGVKLGVIFQDRVKPNIVQLKRWIA